MMDKIIEEIDRTELNAVVIDVKDDQGRITYAMDSPTVNEIRACQVLSGHAGAVGKAEGAWNLYHSQGGGVQGSVSCRTEAGMEPACG